MSLSRRGARNRASCARLCRLYIPSGGPALIQSNSQLVLSLLRGIVMYGKCRASLVLASLGAALREMVYLAS